MENNKPKLTFDKIKSIDNSSFTSISYEEVISTCIIDFRKGSQEMEILQFLLNDYIQNLPFLSLEDILFKQIFPEIEIFVETILYNLYNTSEAIELSVLNSGKQLIEILINLLNYVISINSEFNLFEINSLSSGILSILDLLYQYSKTVFECPDTKTEEFLIEFKIFFNHCKNLQNLIVCVIITKGTNIVGDIDVCKKGDHYIQLLNQLIEIAEKVSQIDIKSTAEIWKCIVLITSKNSTFLKMYQRFGDCLDKLVNLLTKEICNNLTSVEDMEKEEHEKVFKINSFYVNILLKVSNNFESDYFCGAEHVIKCLIECLKLEKDDDLHLTGMVNQHVTVGLISVLLQINNTTKFVNTFFQFTSDLTNIEEEYIEVCLILIQYLIKQDDTKLYSIWLGNSEQNILNIIFYTIVKSKQILCDGNFYRKVVGYLSYLILKNVNHHSNFYNIEKILKSSINQNESFLLGCLSIDLWTLVTGNLVPEAVYFYVNYWKKYLKHQSVTSNYPKTIFIKILFKNLYDLLLSKYKIEFYENYPPNKNVLIWCVLGVDKISNNHDKTCVLEQSYNIIDKLMIEFVEGKMEVDGYYKMLNNLHLISTQSTIINDNYKFKQNLNFLWNLLLDFKHINLFTNLIVVVLRLLKLYKDELSLNTVEVFEKLKTLAQMLDSCKTVKLEILLFSKGYFGLTHEFENLVRICGDDFLEVYFSNPNQKLSADVKSLVSIKNVKFKHICSTKSDDDGINEMFVDDVNDVNISNTPKRLKVDEDGDDIMYIMPLGTPVDATSLLNDLSMNMESILKHHKNVGLSKSDLNKLKGIVNNANMLFKNSFS